MAHDRLWYDRRELTPTARAVLAATDAYLQEQRRGLNLPDPAVEAAVAAIPEDAPPEVLRLAGIGGGIRAAGITWRHIEAQNAHRNHHRERQEDRRLSPEEARAHGLDPNGEHSMTVMVADADPVTAWLQGQSDAVVLGLISENPLWLRSPAIADRVCRWRCQLLASDLPAWESARANLDQLAGRRGARGRPAAGPAAAPADIRAAVTRVEAQNRAERETWGRVREELPDGAALTEVGRAWLLRLWDWDAHPRLREQKIRPEHVTAHLVRHLVIVGTSRGTTRRWIVIDDNGWPRVAAVALLAARWDVSPAWVLKRLSA
jgi:hypothetical protein